MWFVTMDKRFNSQWTTLPKVWLSCSKKFRMICSITLWTGSTRKRNPPPPGNNSWLNSTKRTLYWLHGAKKDTANKKSRKDQPSKPKKDYSMPKVHWLVLLKVFAFLFNTKLSNRDKFVSIAKSQLKSESSGVDPIDLVRTTILLNAAD